MFIGTLPRGRERNAATMVPPTLARLNDETYLDATAGRASEQRDHAAGLSPHAAIEAVAALDCFALVCLTGKPRGPHFPHVREWLAELSRLVLHRKFRAPQRDGSSHRRCSL